MIVPTTIPAPTWTVFLLNDGGIRAVTVILVTILATRGAPPARQPRCLKCSGWEHGRAERRPAGAGLGTTVEAKESAMLSGQRALWKAASRTVTVGSGEERPREWRAPWGPPDGGSRPQLLELRLVAVITIRIRREEGEGASRPISLSPTSSGKGVRGGIREHASRHP